MQRKFSGVCLATEQAEEEEKSTPKEAPPIALLLLRTAQQIWQIGVDSAYTRRMPIRPKFAEARPGPARPLGKQTEGHAGHRGTSETHWAAPFAEIKNIIY